MAAPPVFYILHGEDDLGIETELAALLGGTSENAELNTSRFDGTQTSVSEILGAAMAYPFLSDTRIVIVRDLLAHITRRGAGETGKKAAALLSKELPNLPDWTRLILVEREKLTDANKIVKEAQATPRARVKAFNPPSDSTDWIMRRAKSEYHTSIEPAAAAALASVTPGDLRRADNELFKLAAYASGRTITESDVALLTAYVAEASIFAMTDALAEGRADRAAALLHALISQPGQNPNGIYVLIVRQFERMLLVREALDMGKKMKDIMQELDLREFAAEKVIRQVRGFTLPQLETIFRRLRDYDRDMKTGKIDPVLAMDLLIAAVKR